MEQKQINRWLRRKFSAVGWVLVCYYVLMNVLVMVQMVLDSVRQMLEQIRDFGWIGEMDVEALVGNGWAYILTILTGFVILWAWKGGDYWRGEVFARGPGTMKPGTAACMVCLCLGAQMINALWIAGLEAGMNAFDKSLLEQLEGVSGSSGTFSMFLYTAILAPIAEELLFRGYVLRTLRPFGKRFAIFASALLFGMFHGNLLQAPYAFLAGLLLGYAATEYSVKWAIALHMFNNLVLADLLTRLLEVLPLAAAEAINAVIFGGGLVAAVVILILKRNAVRDYRRGEYMDRRCLKCFFTSPGVLVLIGIQLASMVSLLIMV